MNTRTRFTNWRKATASAPDSNCVEIAFADNGIVGVRDSKHTEGPHLEFDPHTWRAFTHALRANDS